MRWQYITLNSAEEVAAFLTTIGDERAAGAKVAITAHTTGIEFTVWYR